jgi:hypothetical protein
MKLEPVRRSAEPGYPHREERRRALRLLAIGGASLAAGGLLGCDTLRDVLGLSRPHTGTVGKMPAVHPPAQPGVQPGVQPTAPSDPGEQETPPAGEQETPPAGEQETPPAGDTDTDPTPAGDAGTQTDEDGGKDPATKPGVVPSAHPDADVAGGLRAPHRQPEPVPTDGG